MPTTAVRQRRTTAEPKTNIIAMERASLRRLRQFVADLPAEFLECRQYNHAWTGHTVTRGKKQYTVVLLCLRCKSHAREILSDDGSREGKRSIQYVEGYLAHGMGRLDGQARAALRLEGVHRNL